jgi:predicted DNA-binding transcriptional regulator YafY
LRSQLETLRAATVSLVAPTEVVSTEQLLALARACDECLLVTFAYRAQNGTRTERRAEPYRLVATDRRWYLVAYDLDRDAWRTFRVDRASSVVAVGHTFVPRAMEDPAGMVANAISTAIYDHKAIVRIDAPYDEVAPMIAPTVGILTSVGDGRSCRLQLGADDFEWAAGYIVSLGLPFEVLEPVGLRAYVAALGERLVQAHGRDGVATA